MAFYQPRHVRAYQFLVVQVVHARIFQDVYYMNFPDDKLWQKGLGQYPQRPECIYTSVLNIIINSVWVLYI